MLPLLAGLAALTVATSLVACVPNPGTTPKTSDADGRAQSADLLERLIPADGPGCSAAVAIKGEIAWAGARGLAELEHRKALTTSSVFDLASVSKQFTATALLLLAQDGELALDDTLDSHLTGLPGWADTVTLAQLMHHSSGIPDYTELLAKKGFEISETTTQADALAALGDVHKLGFSPGERFEYSNSNYLLLAEVIERRSGMPLADFLDRRLFSPLELDMRLAPGLTGGDTATSYSKVGDEYRQSVSGWQQVGDGSVYATPTELARWGDNYRTGQVGGPEYLDDVSAGAIEIAPGYGSYGAGIEVSPDGDLSHLGGWSGFVTAFGVTGDREASLAVSCNADSADVGTIAEGLRVIWARP